jgi:hypothetical protein
MMVISRFQTGRKNYTRVARARASDGLETARSLGKRPAALPGALTGTPLALSPAARDFAEKDLDSEQPGSIE